MVVRFQQSMDYNNPIRISLVYFVILSEEITKKLLKMRVSKILILFIYFIFLEELGFIT